MMDWNHSFAEPKRDVSFLISFYSSPNYIIGIKRRHRSMHAADDAGIAGRAKREHQEIEHGCAEEERAKS
jgi:endonuclease IV